MPAADVVAHAADYTRTRDTIALRDGELVIDTRHRSPISVAARDTTVAIANARVVVVAHDGAIVTTNVFAGSVEITTATSRSTIATGGEWTRPLNPSPSPKQQLSSPPKPSPAAASMSAFRAGWQALHAGRTAAAIAAFDRATDPVVAEDAAFWAAVAAARAGHAPDAGRRLRAFLAGFPASPHADAARATLATLPAMP